MCFWEDVSVEGHKDQILQIYVPSLQVATDHVVLELIDFLLCVYQPLIDISYWNMVCAKSRYNKEYIWSHLKHILVLWIYIFTPSSLLFHYHSILQAHWNTSQMIKGAKEKKLKSNLHQWLWCFEWFLLHSRTVISALKVYSVLDLPSFLLLLP